LQATFYPSFALTLLHWYASRLCAAPVSILLKSFMAFPNGKYQCEVFFFTGDFPLNVLTGIDQFFGA
jgi:hypothetical protein